MRKSEQDVSPSAIEEANTLLDFLASRVNTNWETVMRETLSHDASASTGVSEFSRAMATVMAAKETLGIEAPVGAIVGGTGVAKAEAGLEGEESQRAVQALKAADRLVQCGKGRGKCLVLLSVTPLHADEFATSNVRANTVDTASNDAQAPMPAATRLSEIEVDTILRSVRDNFRRLNAEHTECGPRLRQLERQIASLQGELDAANARIQEVMSERAVTSWS